MSRAGSSSAWITVTAKLLLLKSYSSCKDEMENKKKMWEERKRIKNALENCVKNIALLCSTSFRACILLVVVDVVVIYSWMLLVG